MTYIDYINQFWQIRRYKPMTAHEADFYFFLLKECNIRNWLCPFELPTRLIQAELGYSNKTVIDLRNRLKQKGLIDFIEGNRREKAASYTLLVTSGNQTGNQTGNPFIKTKTKTKTNSSGELFAHEDEQQKKSGKKSEFIAPTLEQVMDYFEGRLPDWREQAEMFYYHFDSLGWRNSNGARIERWDSRANLWITEKIMQDGRKQNDNAGHPVTVANPATAGTGKGIDPDAGSIEEWINSIPVGR